MAKVIKNLVTTIGGGDIGSLVVTWDLETFFDEPRGVHPDNPTASDVEYRRVDKIRSVEFQAFDKVGVDLTWSYNKDLRLLDILSEKLIAAVAEQPTKLLEAAA